jgi:hypothetical protein
MTNPSAESRAPFADGNGDRKVANRSAAGGKEAVAKVAGL